VNREDKCRSGFVAIVRRQNVGKSTLINHSLGQKIRITSSKPQTTRHRILGIHTTDKAQVIYVDTPGVHLNAKKAMNRYMNRAATSSFEEVELILFLVDAGSWTEEDENVLQRLKTVKAPVVLLANKVDRIKDKEELFPVLQELSEKMDFLSVIPLSALKGSNVQALEKLVHEQLPVAPPMFPEDYVTDRSERFLAAELIREKLMRGLGKELPYSTAVEIESFKEEKKLLHIHALIWVERESQKRIVIGKGGEKLKEVGKQARLDMEKLFGSKVFLEMWVKVKEGWSDNERILNSLGYKDEL